MAPSLCGKTLDVLANHPRNAADYKEVDGKIILISKEPDGRWYGGSYLNSTTLSQKCE